MTARRDNYCGLLTKHNIDCFDSINQSLQSYKISLMIELGFWQCGFTLFLHNMHKDIPLYSFDLRDVPEYVSKFFNDNVIFVVDDVLKEPNKRIIKLIIENKNVLLYCDNGNKREEVAMYAPYLKSGDILGIHDWGSEIFEEDITKLDKKLILIVQDRIREDKRESKFWFVC